MRPRNAAASGTARTRWVWLPSPGRVALQRSCALQLLQFLDSTIGLAMLPRRFDCSNSTRVAHAHDDLSRQPPKSWPGELHSRMDRGSGRPCKAPFVRFSQPSVRCTAEPARSSDCCARRGRRRVGSTSSRWCIQVTSLLPQLPGCIRGCCASDTALDGCPLHLSNI